MSEARDPAEPAGPEEVGSLAEEAARLLGSLAGLAQEHDPGPDPGPAAATSPECAVCPVCRTLRAVRGLSPEVRSHLTAAATHLLQAGLSVLSHVPAGDDTTRTTPASGPGDSSGVPDGSPRPSAGRKRPRVEHIDLGTDWPEDREQG